MGSLWKIIHLTVLLTLKAHSLPTEYGGNADAGELRQDILEINLESQRDLFEGDIVGDRGRNAILDETKRWIFPIPYILTDSLDLNAKGVILQAFEMYCLKSCVDFKPYEGESTYISFTKLDGCWSFVGDLKTGQNVSIGEGCDTKAIIEHELLHALGFYHEQSRSDRDDYVKIWWDQIIPGKEHNFNKYEDDFITDLNTPYDYESIMHYRPLSFNKDPDIPTITTTIPAFNRVIGQRLDFSALDLERLNRMYDCTATHTLLDQCAFEQINICGMIQYEEDDADWVQTLGSADVKDHTLGGKCRDAGYYMKFDTASKPAGHSSLLESRILYPKRNQQCLEFFYRMSSTDQLSIWVRTDDGTGFVRKVSKVHTIKGDDDESWKIAHVALNLEEKFRYFFQGIAGSLNILGGIYIDDITLTETSCPNAVWRVQNFTNLLYITPHGEGIKSDPFYNSEGYSYGITVYPNGRLISSQEFVGITFHLISGENDVVLEWPAMNRQVTVTTLDQNTDALLQMSNSRSFTTEHKIIKNWSPLTWFYVHIEVNGDQWFWVTNILQNIFFCVLQKKGNHTGLICQEEDKMMTDISVLDNGTRWEKPSTVGEWDDNCKCFRGPEFGWSTFISHDQLHRRDFLKNDDLIITANFDDLTHLVKSEVPVKPTLFTQSTEENVGIPKVRKPRAISDPCQPNPCHNGALCVSNQGKATCRCISGQAIVYTGNTCEKQHIDGRILGVLIGSVAGMVVLTLAIITVIYRQQR